MAFPGFDLSLASALLMHTALGACPVESAPRVVTHFAVEPLYYSEAHSSDALRASMSQDKESTLNTDKRSAVFGVTTSITSSNFKVSFNTLTDETGNQCLYVDTATFWITYRPAVFISKDILNMPCTLNVTKAHENEHVKIDTQAIRDYLPHIERDMLLHLRSLGYQGFGPYPKDQMPTHQKQLLENLVAASKPMTERLREARRKRQGEIDTPENYQREAAKCPQDLPAIYERFYRKAK